MRNEKNQPTAQELVALLEKALNAPLPQTSQQYHQTVTFDSPGNSPEEWGEDYLPRETKGDVRK